MAKRIKLLMADLKEKHRKKLEAAGPQIDVVDDLAMEINKY